MEPRRPEQRTAAVDRPPSPHPWAVHSFPWSSHVETLGRAFLENDAPALPSAASTGPW